MKKRYLSLLLAVVMLCAMLPQMPIKAEAVAGVYTWITDRNQIDGSDYTTSSALAKKLNQIFDGNASVYSDWNCTNLVDARIGTSNLKDDNIIKYVGPYGGGPINSGTSCWIYANGVYYTLFGECTASGTAGPNSEKLNIGSTSSTIASYDNFKTWGVRQDVGALIRANGHSMIVLDYDQDYLTILDGNGNSNGLVSIRVRSWDQASFSVSYIIQPKESFFYTTYPTCNHNYNNLGICTSTCKSEYNWQATYDTSCAGIYKVSLSGGIYLRTDKPYSASTAKSNLIKEGTKVQVLGSVLNAVGKENHLWYKVSYNGVVGYTSEDNLTLVPHTCDKGTYMYYEEAHPHRSCYKCSICGKIWAEAGSTNKMPSCQQCAASSEHTCNKGTYMYYEEVHPHRSCYKCSICGKIWAADGTTNYMPSCLTCQKPGKPVLTNLSGKTYQVGENVTFTWGETSNTTHYNLYIQHKNASGQWEKYDQLFYVTNGMTLTFPANQYRCCIQSYNSNYWAADGSDWLYTEGDFTYFTVETCSHTYICETTQPATCFENGYNRFTCVNCGDSYTEVIIATGYHSWGAWSWIEEPTCTGEGVKYRRCNVCGEEEIQMEPAKGHTWSGMVTLQPTCSKEGELIYDCVYCDATMKDSISATGEHKWGVWVPDTEASCTTDGTQLRACYICGDVQAQSIPALGHQYENGYCTRCNAKDPDYQLEPAQIIAGNVTGRPGKTVTVPISISNNPGFAGFTFVIDYDSTVMTLDDIIKGDILRASSSGAFTAGTASKIVNWTDTRNTTEDGIILYLSFTIKDHVGAGDYPISISLRNGQDTNFVNENAHAQKVVFRSGAVSVVTYISGDANGDGIVSDADAIYLLRSTLFGIEKYPTYCPRDVNGDSVVSDADAIYLLRHTLFPKDYPLLR